MTKFEEAIALLVERDDGGPPTDDDLWRESQLPGFHLPRWYVAWRTLRNLGLGLENEVPLPKPKRGPGNPNFKKRRRDHLDDIEEDARWLWSFRKGLNLYECRLAAATHWLRYYEKADGDIETMAADLVEKVCARAEQ